MFKLKSLWLLSVSYMFVSNAFALHSISENCANNNILISSKIAKLDDQNKLLLKQNESLSKELKTYNIKNSSEIAKLDNINKSLLKENESLSKELKTYKDFHLETIINADIEKFNNQNNSLLEELDTIIKNSQLFDIDKKNMIEFLHQEQVIRLLIENKDNFLRLLKNIEGVKEVYQKPSDSDHISKYKKLNDYLTIDDTLGFLNTIIKSKVDFSNIIKMYNWSLVSFIYPLRIRMSEENYDLLPENSYGNNIEIEFVKFLKEYKN